MAGGVFSAQNKVRPGAYVKFQGVPSSNNLIGSRGIVAFAAPVGWGVEDELIKITVNDLYNNSNLEKLIGYNIGSNSNIIKLIKAALENAHTLLLYRADIDGDKADASLTVGEGITLTVTAKYAGTVGNAISIKIEDIGSTFNVSTYLGGTLKDSQSITNINQLIANDFVEFAGEGVIASEVVNTLLTGGADGDEFDTSNYGDFLNLLREEQFDTLAAYHFGSVAFFSGESVKAFIQDMRESRGIKSQAVINNYVSADHEGIISTNNQGVTFADGNSLSGDEMVIWVAGATAGADVTASNTYKIIPNAKTITNDVLEANIEALINQGYLIISKRRDGVIVIEKDINTLVTMREDTTVAFKENKVIRLLDAIANRISLDFETNFIGKVNNDDTGRALFKASIISYLTSLQASGAIINFNSTTDVTVDAGEQPDSYYSEIYVQPTYSVDKLYMVVNVR